MGLDKGLMRWYSKEQRYHAADLLQQFCNKVYISCRQEQAAEMEKPYKALPDKYKNIGPLGGLLSAFDFNCQCAWLVLACDMPLVDTKTVHHLIQERNKKVIATTYKNPDDGLPEPLLTIWEPQAYPLLQAVFEQGGGLRKVLLNNKIKMIDVEDVSTILNVNTMSDAERMKALL